MHRPNNASWLIFNEIKSSEWCIEVSTVENFLTRGFLLGVSQLGKEAYVSSALAAGEKNTRSMVKNSSKKSRGLIGLLTGISLSFIPVKFSKRQ